MLERDRLREQMIENAAEINRLHQRIHEKQRKRAESEEFWKQWSCACEELHNRYAQLCLPGGWDSGFLDRLKDGDPHTLEVALCFLEVRPYFIRSGYLWKDLLNKCKRVPMTGEQAKRFSTLLNKYQEYKVNRNSKSRQGAKVRKR